jgi:hypothetical protein
MVFTFLLFAIILASSSTIVNLGIVSHVDARCPAGSHKSPSGDCEKVTDNKGKPRCPNGYHRSPGGICERVTSIGDNGGGSSDSDISGDGVIGSLGGEGHSSKGASNGAINGDSSQPFADADTNNNNPESQSFRTNHSTDSKEVKCDQSLWNHVYNPQRLQVVDPCKTVSGIIESKRSEADGDYHIRLKLDPQFSNLVNAANLKEQFGDLVLEPICMNRVTQTDAISACHNFRQSIEIPAVGSHVQVTGSYVLDKQHGKWAEIHPITSINKLP